MRASFNKLQDMNYERRLITESFCPKNLFISSKVIVEIIRSILFWTKNLVNLLVLILVNGVKLNMNGIISKLNGGFKIMRIKTLKTFSFFY